MVRHERSDDAGERAAIRDVNQSAFGRDDEAVLVDRLRKDGVTIASLVAELEHRVVGHILFSRMWIDKGEGTVPAAALAPMAIRVEYQRRGIGGQLIRYGLDVLRGRGEEIVIVVGHPAYYPQFGFTSEKTRNLESPFPVEAFMALDLRPGALDAIRGKVRYPAAFGL